MISNSVYGKLQEQIRKAVEAPMTGIQWPFAVKKSGLNYSYRQMRKDLKELTNICPELIRVHVLGTTADGREIQKVQLGEEDAPAHVLIQASIHGREHMNTILAMNQIEDYLRCRKEGRDRAGIEGSLWERLYRDICFHVIPMANPDGVTISQEGVEGIISEELRARVRACYENDRISGKTTDSETAYYRTWKANARGVDLNRNFDAGWKEYTGTSHPSGDCCKGPYPASEEETKAILEVGQKYPLKCCVSYHSYGNLIYWDYGKKGEALEAERRLARCAAEATGYTLCSAVQSAAASAGCSDYFSGKLGIPALTIENGGVPCPLPIEEYGKIYKHCKCLWPKLALLHKEVDILR